MALQAEGEHKLSLRLGLIFTLAILSLYLASFKLESSLLFKQDLEVTVPALFRKLRDVDLQLDIPDSTVAKQVSSALRKHNQRVNFGLTLANYIVGSEKLTVEACQDAQHEVLRCKYIVLEVVEEVLKLPYLVIEHSFGNLALHLGRQVLVKLVVFEVVSC